VPDFQAEIANGDEMVAATQRFCAGRTRDEEAE